MVPGRGHIWVRSAKSHRRLHISHRTTVIGPVGTPLRSFAGRTGDAQLHDRTVARDRAAPAQERATLVAIEDQRPGDHSRITGKAVASCRSRHANAADHALRVGDDHGLLAQPRVAAFTAQRLNDAVDLSVGRLGRQRARRKAMPACIAARARLAGGGARTRALLRVLAVRRHLMRCRDGRDPSWRGASPDDLNDLRRKHRAAFAERCVGLGTSRMFVRATA